MPQVVKRIGMRAVFGAILKKLGLDEIVAENFGNKTAELLTGAHYMMCEGNVMNYIEDWLDENISFNQKKLTDSDMSRLFSEIEENEKLSFFKEWMKKRNGKEYIAYDVTSVSTYGKGIGIAEWGYNRDKEKLPQINLGMFCGEESKLPLYYRIYPGSIPDKAHLKYMTEDTGLLAVQNLRYVMDRGFYSADNLRFLTEKGIRFIIALPGSLNYVKEIIDRHGKELVNHSEYDLGAGKPYGTSYESTELGFRMKIHLYYDPIKAAQDNESLRNEILRMEDELSRMQEPPDRKLHYDRYFFINRSKEGKLGFIRNTNAINEAMTRNGFFLIAETDFKKTTAEILDLYRRRDVIEKSFDDLKNGLDMHRFYVHCEKTADGKLFTAFLALIVRSYILNHLQDYMDRNKFSFEKIVLEFNKIKLIFSPDSPAHSRLLNPISSSLKEILSLLDLNEDIFEVCYNSLGI